MAQDVDGPVLAPFDGADLDRLYAHAPGTLRVNFVVGLDGSVAVGGRSGPLGGPPDQELLGVLRAQADVVLVGAGTVRRERYGPAWLSSRRQPARAARGQEPLPAVAVVTASAELDPASRLFAERRPDQPAPPRPVVITCAAAPPERVERLAGVAHVVVAGDAEVDLAAALGALGRDRKVLCEGGPRLLGDLLCAGLVDELCITHAAVLAGAGAPTLLGASRWEPPEPARFRAAHVLSADGMLMARWVPRGTVG